MSVLTRSILFQKPKVVSENLNELNLTVIINAALVLVFLTVVFIYIVNANIMAANSYKIKQANDQLNLLNEIHANLMSQKGGIDEILKIKNFAKNQNMIEAKNIIYLFENGNIALVR